MLNYFYSPFNKNHTALYKHQQHLTRIRFRRHSNQPLFKTGTLLLNKTLPNTMRVTWCFCWWSCRFMRFVSQKLSIFPKRPQLVFYLFYKVNQSTQPEYCSVFPACWARLSAWRCEWSARSHQSTRAPAIICSHHRGNT